MKVKDTAGSYQTVRTGVNKAGKSTEKKQARSRKITPKANKPTSSRPKRPGG